MHGDTPPVKEGKQMFLLRFRREERLSPSSGNP